MKAAEIKELIRSAYRPILITILAFGTFFFIIEGISGLWVDWWNRVFLFGACEWILERPVIKLATKKP